MTIEERQEAAKWFQNRASHTSMPGAKMMFERAAEALSEGMQPHWIPRSEGLPGVNGSYLVTVHPNYIVPGGIHVDMLSWLMGSGGLTWTDRTLNFLIRSLHGCHYRSHTEVRANEL